jgi:DNA replication protein DnaC
MQVMPPQLQSSTELLTEVCEKCGKEAFLSTADGWCGECDWFRRLEESKKKKRKDENDKRRVAMLEMLGEGAVDKFTFEKFEVYDETSKKALGLCKAFEPGVHNFFLFGMTGTGKSHLACAMTMRAFDAEKSVHFFPSGPSLSRWTRGLDGPEEDKRIDDLARVDVLVINELGIGRDTEYSIGVAVEVIDRRIMRGKNGLIVTSNFHPADLAVKMSDARLESRFTGLCKIIETGKVDFRRKHRKA